MSAGVWGRSQWGSERTRLPARLHTVARLIASRHAAAGASLMLVGPRGPVSAAGLYHTNSESGDGPSSMVHALASSSSPLWLAQVTAAC